MFFVLLKVVYCLNCRRKKPPQNNTHNYKVLPHDLQLNQHLQEKQNPLRM